MSTEDTKKRIIVSDAEFKLLGFDDGENVTSTQFCKRLAQVCAERANLETKASSSAGSATALTEQLRMIETAIDEGFTTFQRRQDAANQQIERLAELRNWFDLFRSETLNFMNHILNESAGVRKLLDRLTTNDPEEIAEIKAELDRTFQRARSALDEREADYKELYQLHEAHLVHLRLLEGAEPTPGLEQDRDQTEEMEIDR